MAVLKEGGKKLGGRKVNTGGGKGKKKRAAKKRLFSLAQVYRGKKRSWGASVAWSTK